MCLRNVDEDLEGTANLSVRSGRSASAEATVDHGSREYVRTDADYAPVAETARSGWRWEWSVGNVGCSSVVKKVCETLKAAADGLEKVVRIEVVVGIVRMAKPTGRRTVHCSLL